MPKIHKAEANERNEGKGAARGAALLELAETRAITPDDLFCSLAAMVTRQNPNLGGKLLDALELTIRQRPEVEVLGGPLGNVTETAGETVTVTAEHDAAALDVSALVAGLPQYCPSPSGDGICPSPMACKAGCEREFGTAAAAPPADVAFEAPAHAEPAAA